MSLTLTEVAQQLNSPRTNKKGQVKPIPKVQLIYAFNGSGKTRLSREFKDLIAPKNDDGKGNEVSRDKILYYNAFTEDLFYWDNDLKDDTSPKLKIQSNSFTDWVLKDQGKESEIVTNFQHYTTDKITPVFNAAYKVTLDDGKIVDIPEYSEVTFRLNLAKIRTEDEEPILTEDGDSIVTEQYDVIKISKGEESNFIWSVFYSLLQEVVSVLSETDPDNRETEKFNDLEYIFIDDPVCSLDENHLIELGVSLAVLIKSAPSKLKFIITTHNPLFYNVLHSEFRNKLSKSREENDDEAVYRPKEAAKYRLIKNADQTFEFKELGDDTPFSYHLFLLSEIKAAIKNNEVKKFHFNFLRHVLEKTATFLGHKKWFNLLPQTLDGNPEPWANRIINLAGHSIDAGEEVAEPQESDVEKLNTLVNTLIEKYGFLEESING